MINRAASLPQSTATADRPTATVTSQQDRLDRLEAGVVQLGIALSHLQHLLAVQTRRMEAMQVELDLLKTKSRED